MSIYYRNVIFVTFKFCLISVGCMECFYCLWLCFSKGCVVQIYLATKRVQYSQSGILVKVCWFHTTYQCHYSLRAPKVLLLGVYMWKDVMAPERVPIYLDRVVSQHVSSLKQEWISPKSTYPWSLGQSDATCAWYLQCTCMTLCTHPFIYSWVPWDGGRGRRRRRRRRRVHHTDN